MDYIKLEITSFSVGVSYCMMYIVCNLLKSLSLVVQESNLTVFKSSLCS